MKKFMLIMLALVLAGLAFAQTDITIGTGISTGRYPFNDYYVYSRSQCIYLESEIGAPGTIHKLRWYRNDTGADANAIGTTQIWLKTVSNAVLTDATWEEPGTMVAEISNIDLGAGGAWYEVDITDFAYAGGNLLVSVYTQNAPYTTPHSYWRYTATTGFNRCRLGNSDTVNPPTLSLSTARPNIQINMTAGAPTVAPNPAILAAPMNGGYALLGDVLSWNSGGGFPATYDVYLDTVDGSTMVSDNQAGLTYTPTLAPGTTYYWKVVPANAFGDAVGCPVWSFMTPAADQVVESFENTAFPPAGWANGTTGNWTRSTSYYKHGTASAYKYGSTTTAYVLSTPKVTIEATSTLNLWTLASSATGTLQVVYSPDRVTWTPLGDPIAHAATYTWYNTVADLSSLAGNNYYLGVQTGLQSASFYTDMYIAPAITPEAPGAPVLTAPADLATNVNENPTITWTAPTTGGVPTGYNLYMDTVDGSTLYASGVSSPYAVPIALDYNTTYYWTVEAYNGAGTGPQAAVRSFTTRANPTISTFPWEVNFGTLAGDWPVLNWSQLINQYGTALVAGTRWYQDDFVNVASPLNKAAKMNIWSANYGWLVTPPIAIPAAGYELKFDIGLTAYGSTSAVTAGGQPDDKFMVLVDDNPNMSSPTILREWNNTGSPYVYDNVSNTGENHIIDLDAYTGNVYFAFYGESSVSNGDNDFFVDNVIVRETPVAAIFGLNPDVTDWDFGLSPVDFASTKVFTISNTGGAPLTLSDVSTTGDYYSISVAPGLMTIPAGQSTTFTVQFLPTVAGGPYTGTLDISFAREIRTVNLTGSAYEPATLPLSEGFEAGFGDWVVVNGTQTNIWYTGTATYNSGAQSAYISNDLGVTNAYTDNATTTAHFYKDVAFTPGNNRYELSFFYNCGGESTYDGLKVYLVDTNVVPVAGAYPAGTQLGATWYNLTTGWTPVTINLGNEYAGTVKRLIFTWRNDSSVGTQPPVALDDISLVAYQIMPPNAVVLASPADEATGVILTPTLSWNAPVGGDAATGYKVYFGTDVNPPYLDTTSALSYSIDTELPYNTVHYWKIVPFNAEGDGTASSIWNFTTMVDPNQPAAAPILVGPTDGQTNVPIEGPTFTWEQNLAGGVVDAYTLFVYNSNADEGEFFSTEYYYESVTSPFTPDNIPYGYDEHWFWTVVATSAASPDMFYQWPPNEFVIESDPHVAIPYAQDFGTDTTWPTNWIQTSTGSNVWTVSATANAGGTASEMKATWVSLNGTTRLITPPLSTTGVQNVSVAFNTYYDDYGTGINAKVQYSHDLVTWYDTAWVVASGGGNVTGLQTALITGLVDQPTTYVAWTLDGNHFQYDYWYVDDVSITLPFNHDVVVVSYDTPAEVVPENTLVTPMATVMNNGINTETFDVTCTIGTYTNTQTVTGLEMGQSQQVSFAPLTPELWTANAVAIEAILATDEVPANNTKSGALICIDLDKTGLANNAQTDQFVQFNLADPTTLYPLTTPFAGTNFVSGGDWMNGNWMGVNYDDGTLANDFYYNINPITGEYLPAIGEPGVALMGIAYDDNNDIMYGAGNGNLYTMDAMGLATLGGTLWYNLEGTPTNFVDIGGLMIDIAYDNTNNILYGIDLGNDALWTINPATYELTLNGFFGVDLNYAQDAAFDQDGGQLYLAAYSTFGGLYWVDTTSGGAYLVAPFGGANAYELDGFAIPYGLAPETPVVSIAGEGTLTWTPVLGAVSYNVYSSDDPYGTFTLEANVIGTEYLGAAAAKKFYKVAAVGGRLSSAPQELMVNTLPRKTGRLGVEKRNNTGIAR